MNDIIPDFIKAWLGKLDADKHCVLFRPAYVEICDGNIPAALIFGQMLYYSRPGKKGATKLRINRNGHLWLAKTHDDWWVECGVSKHLAKRAIQFLCKELRLIVVDHFKFAGNRTQHIRIDFEALQARIRALGSEQNAPTGAEDNCSDRSEQITPTGQCDALRPLTEITAEITKERRAPTSPDGEEKTSSFPGEAPPAQVAAAPLQPAAIETTDPAAPPNPEDEPPLPPTDESPPPPDNEPPLPPVELCALPDPRSPEFPKKPNGRDADWAKGIEMFDAITSAKLAAIFPGFRWPEHPSVARTYYKGRLSGKIHARHVELLSRFWKDMHNESNPEWRRPRTAEELLQQASLKQPSRWAEVLQIAMDSARFPLMILNDEIDQLSKGDHGMTKNAFAQTVNFASQSKSGEWPWPDHGPKYWAMAVYRHKLGQPLPDDNEIHEQIIKELADDPLALNFVQVALELDVFAVFGRNVVMTSMARLKSRLETAIQQRDDLQALL